MATCHQYRPVAVAAEIVCERWNALIARNLMFGADTFSAIANGVPSMSRLMLMKRLDELQRATGLNGGDPLRPAAGRACGRHGA